MNIGFIGAGGMAKALAGKWAAKHEVMLSGRDLHKTEAAASSLGVRAGTAQEAAHFGDVIVLATRWEDVFSAIENAGGPAAFEGKTVIDINKVGTIFHDTKLPLRKWFMAIWLITNNRSASRLSGQPERMVVR
jgi:predicted dinucleotide-binding enzyme